MIKKQVAAVMAAVLLFGVLLAGCASEEPQVLSRPENPYVVAAAAVYVNGALYLRENTDSHIYYSLPDDFVRVGNVSKEMPDANSVEEEFAAWNLLAGQMIYASAKDVGCIYVHYPLDTESYCYVRMYRADLYEYWSAADSGN